MMILAAVGLWILGMAVAWSLCRAAAAADRADPFNDEEAK